MSLTFQQIMLTAYRAEFYLNQFSLADNNDGNGVFISSWTVPNVTQPSHDEVMALDTPALEASFNYYSFQDTGMPLLDSYIDSVAQQKNYANAVACSSYLNSTVAAWSAQATTFIAWRDAVYNYAIAQFALMEAGTRTVPTFAEFQTELPVITWPA
jgi:hypothetical protein